MLKGLDLRLAPGEIFCLLGPNGAGKSTVQKLLRGSLAPSTGTVRVFGTDPRLGDGAWRSRLAWVSDRPALHARLSVRENLQGAAALFGRSQAESDAACEQVGLTELARQRAGNLSRGQGQRLAWARALLARAELFLLDEPTGGLDVVARQAVHDLIRAARDAGATLLLSTHDMSEAQALADRVGILHEGRLLDVGSPSELCLRHLEQELPPASQLPSLERVYRLLTGRSLIHPSELPRQ